MMVRRNRPNKGEWCTWERQCVKHDCGGVSRGKSKTIRYRCPICKRRMKIGASKDDDETCYLYVLPRHKVRR